MPAVIAPEKRISFTAGTQTTCGRAGDPGTVASAAVGSVAVQQNVLYRPMIPDLLSSTTCRGCGAARMAHLPGLHPQRAVAPPPSSAVRLSPFPPSPFILSRRLSGGESARAHGGTPAAQAQSCRKHPRIHVPAARARPVHAPFERRSRRCRTTCACAEPTLKQPSAVPAAKSAVSAARSSNLCS